MRRIAKLVASFFYLGHSPLIPGTVGALAGLVIYFLVREHPLLYIFSFAFLFLLGIIFSGEAEKIYKRKDAKAIVIDEACGILLALAFLPRSTTLVVIGFILFRFFDIIKPPPARSLEKLAGPWGIMLDDILAAIYTNTILQILLHVFHIR